MSTTSVGQIGLDLVVNQKQFNKQMSGIQSLASKTGKLLAGAFATKQIVNFGKRCLELGSDLQEVQNVVDVTFPNMTKKVDAFAKSAASSFGLSETMAKKYTGTFGAMAKAFGFSESAAYDMGSTLTGLAGDVASFYNLTQDEAYTKLKSVFTGETETLKDLGVVMTQTALDSYALANGFGKTTKSMSEAEKVALRYSFVQNQLSATSGDFARTSGSWANQVKVLKLQMESFMSSVGQGLINLFTPAIQVVNTLVGKLVTLGNAFKSFTEQITGKSQESISSGISGITESANAAQDAVSGIGDSAAKAAKKAMGLGGIDELNNLSSSSSATTSAGSNGTSGATITDPTSSIDENKPTVLEQKFSKLAESLDRFKQSASNLADTIKDGLSWCYENVLKPFGEWTLNEAAPAIIELFSAAFDALNEVLEALQPLWQWVWDNFLQPIASFVADSFIVFLETMTDKLTKFSDWCSENQETIETIAVIAGSFFAAWKIASFIAAITPFIITIVNVVSSIKSIEGAVFLAKTALTTLTSGFNPVILIIGAVIAAGILLIKNWDKIKEAALKAVKKIKEVFGTVVDFFGNLFDKVKSKFKAIGSAVGDAIGGAFKTVINGVLSTVENTINKAIRFINSAIKVINKIPGVDISKVKEVSLPRLAQGGFVKKNTPQLAVIGDNRHQGEVVAPEDKLEQMAVNAARIASGNGNKKSNEIMEYMVTLLQRQNELLMAILEKDIGISGEDIFSTTQSQAREYTRRTGKPAFGY
ncbi:MAG: hypothetical protein IJZ53_07620 [Tyzzerella sp.]|nr:hypothetical protein [Tyzzerella sp.]